MSNSKITSPKIRRILLPFLYHTVSQMLWSTSSCNVMILTFQEVDNNYLFLWEWDLLNDTYIIQLFRQCSIDRVSFIFNDSFHWMKYLNSYTVTFSYQRCSMKKVLKKAVLKKFANFTGKHLCQSLLLIKLQASGL